MMPHHMPPGPPGGLPPPMPPPGFGGLPPPHLPPPPGGIPPPMMPHGFPGPASLGLLPRAPPKQAPQPPLDGPGFPYPPGGFKYGKAIGNSYYYTGTDKYQKELRIAAQKTAVQLGYLYLLDLDATFSPYLNSLDGSEIIVITDAENLEAPQESLVRLFFEANCIRHQAFTVASFGADATMDNNGEAQNGEEPIKPPTAFVPGKQLVVLADGETSSKVPDQLKASVAQFVQDGGKVISFNNGVYILEQIFPGQVKGRRGETSADKPLELAPGAKGALFLRYNEEMHLHKQLVRRKGAVRFSVVGADVQVLLKEQAPAPDTPLVVQFKVGKGQVYHSLMSQIVSKVGDQGGTMFQGLSEMLETPAKKLAEQTVLELKKPLPGGAVLRSTQVAWRAAYNAGFHSSINLARSLVLPLDFVLQLVRLTLPLQ